MMIDPLYSLSGFAVGMLVGMTGVGGGALMTPILIMLFGIHPATAVGTDLLYAAATKTGGSLVHGFARSIDWRVVGRLATGSVPATVVTLGALSHFNLSGDAARNLITLVLSVALFATALVLVFGGTIVAAYRARVSELDPQRTAVNTILVGALLGVLVSISSVGAGAIGVVALIMLYPQLPMARIVGSDIAHAVPLTLIAGGGSCGGASGRFSGRGGEGSSPPIRGAFSLTAFLASRTLMVSARWARWSSSGGVRASSQCWVLMKYSKVLLGRTSSIRKGITAMP